MSKHQMCNPFLLLLLHCLARFSAAETHPGDVSVLKNIKAAVAAAALPRSSCVASWDFARDPCDSTASQSFVCGFSCDASNPRSKRIARLELDASGYSGSIPRSIGDLGSLIVLDISQNYFTGSIPPELAKLRNLQKLDLSGNRLSGTIPQSIAQLTKMEYLSVSNNKLSGVLPASIFASMTRLQRLYLQNNQLAGAIPTSLSNCASLRYFDASHNALTETLLFSKLPRSLYQLSIRSNSISFKLDESNVAKFQELEVLDVSSNRIYGSIDSSIFSLPNLQQLNLSHNRLGSINLPDRAAYLGSSQLVAFDASHNNFRGSLPIGLSKLSRLSSLSLSSNQFSNRIPEEYAKKVAADGSTDTLPLSRLLLNGNYLRGDLPGLFLKPLPNLITASFSYNCLNKCPANLPFCSGTQRPASECH